MVAKLISAALTAFFVLFVALALLMLATIVPLGGYHMRIVESGSMSPTIPLGSAIIVRAAPSYNVGDVVTYQRVGDDEATTHRIVGSEVNQGETFFITQGDANNAKDQRPVREQEVFGKVRLSIPYLGYVLDFVRHPLGFLIIVGVPALWIIYEQVMRVLREVKTTKEATQEHI